jgi:hypothetical protein
VRRLNVPAAWPLVLIALLLVPLGRLLDADLTVSWSDGTFLYEPVRGLVVEALRAGRLPLWNPYVGTGAPLLAEGVHGVLHPASLVAALLDARGRVELLVLLYLLCAGVGAGVAARALGVRPAAAVGAGLAYALCGFVLSMGTNLVFLAGAASSPWTIAGLRRAAHPGAGGMVAAAAGTALVLLSGDVQTAALALGVGAALAAQAGGWRGLRRAAAASAAGVALAGVQLVPSIVHLPRTVRWEVDATWRGQWSFSPWRLVELVSPGFFFRFDAPAGKPFLHLAGDCRSLPACVGPFAPSVYVEAPALVLAVLGARRRGAGGVLAAAAGLFLGLAMGPHLGAEQLLGALPGWSLFRYPEKMIGLGSLAAALLAGLGLDALAADPDRPRLAAAAATGAAAFAAAALVAGLAPDATEALLARVPASSAELAGAAAALEQERLADGLWHAAAGLAVVAALAALSRVRRDAPIAVLGAAALGVAGAAALPFALHFTRAEPIDVALPFTGGAGAPVRVYTPYPPPGLPPGHLGLDPVEAVNVMTRVVALPVTNVTHRLDSVGNYSGLMPERFARFVRELPGGLGAAARRLGANVVVATWPADAEQRGALAAVTAGGTLRWSREELATSAWAVPARPWAFFARGASRVTSPAEARRTVAALVSSASDDLVVVEGTEPFGTAPGRVLEVARATEHVRIEAEAAGHGLLVVNDAAWRGWEAEIDGVRAPVLTADGLVRAVPFPPGRHVLTMRYRPPEVLAGAAVTVVGVALVLVLVARERRRA